MPDDRTIDFVVMFIIVGALAIGLLSMFIGWLTRVWDRSVMASSASVPTHEGNRPEQRSDAAEQRREQSGTGGTEHVPGLVEQLAALDDDTLLEVLALVQTDEGDYRFAESRIGRFIGGRLEDRIEQVRAVRGVEPAPPPGRSLRVRDAQGERVIPY